MKGVIRIAQPHGFCGGVRRALDAVERALREYGAPIYVLHEIVHNRFIVNNLKERGVHFAETLAEVPEGAVLLFSAHGVPATVEEEAAKRRLTVIDATCPLVKRLQEAAAERSRPDDALILIGHPGHPEIEGVLGRTSGGTVYVIETAEEAALLPPLPPGTRVSRLAQTTLSGRLVETLTRQLKERYPSLETGPAICYATTDRQAAVIKLARQCKRIVVIGSRGSSNSNRLAETARDCGSRAWLVDSPEEIPPEALEGPGDIGVSAGASAPEELVEATVNFLKARGFTGPVNVGTPE